MQHLGSSIDIKRLSKIIESDLRRSLLKAELPIWGIWHYKDNAGEIRRMTGQRSSSFFSRASASMRELSDKETEVAESLNAKIERLPKHYQKELIRFYARDRVRISLAEENKLRKRRQDAITALVKIIMG